MVSVLVRIEWSGFPPWPVSWCCVLGQETLLSQCYSLTEISAGLMNHWTRTQTSPTSPTYLTYPFTNTENLSIKIKQNFTIAHVRYIKIGFLRKIVNFKISLSCNTHKRLDTKKTGPNINVWQKASVPG